MPPSAGWCFDSVKGDKFDPEPRFYKGSFSGFTQSRDSFAFRTANKLANPFLIWAFINNNQCDIQMDSWHPTQALDVSKTQELSMIFPKCVMCCCLDSVKQLFAVS